MSASWLSAIESIGETALTVAFPEAAPLIGLANKFLPHDKQLPATASGADVGTAIRGLTPDQQLQMQQQAQQCDVAKFTAQADVMKAMFASTANKGDEHGFIAAGSFWVLAITSLLIVIGWLHATWTGDSAMVKSIESDGLTLIGFEGVFAWVLKAYFGAVQMMHSNNVAAATGNPLPKVATGIASIIQAIKG